MCGHAPFAAFRIRTSEAKGCDLNQVALFHDSIYDAVGADVAAIGGVKKAAALLWPHMADSASKLRSCLSTEHPQKLEMEEFQTIIRLAREAGSSAILDYMAQSHGFKKVEWIKPEDERAERERQLISQMSTLTKTFEQFMRGKK